ncbi:PucR family transcriptional regulator [Actinophytocola xinjiangensis]|uniref:PucR family transcriptional regulator n=1 Tax=Actinophytocola xinjiangensis TaxID=485602 RepID=UPI000A03F66D|nr:PucR family transcriptional regulator [Actinophytocola xinjiangensis]
MSTDQRGRWQVLVKGLYLQEHRLADEYLGHTGNGDRYYDGRVDAEDLRTAARQAFRYLIDTLLGRPMEESVAWFPGEVGARRARQGVPLENLVSAVRQDFTVVWSMLLRSAGKDDLPVLAAHVDRLWSAVDELVTRIHVSYLDERMRMWRDDADRQHHLLAQVFAPGGPDEQACAAIGGALRVDPALPFWVVLAPPEFRFGAVTRRLTATGDTFFEHDYRGCRALLLPATQRWELERAVVEDLLAGTGVGLGPRAGSLAAVHRSAEVAYWLVPFSDAAAERPVTVRDGWQRLTVDQFTVAVRVFADHVRTCLAGVADAERGTLLETVAEYVQSGSVLDSAARLYCHRNTVLNRLRRFEELTGLDPRRPRDGALTALVLMAVPPASW